jgi:murein DD-endopeptidase MepM/ murein hydrolase activator NlpD
VLSWASACLVVAAGAAGVAGADTDGAGSAQAASSSTAALPPLVPQDVMPTLEDPQQLASKKRGVTAAREHRERLDRRARTARAAERSRLAAMDPRDLARSMVRARGWGSAQFRCLDSLWARESGWNPSARNASSGAYGIPQALPASKMASAGQDWRTNPVTQIRWGLRYISASYGSPCSAWGHSQSHGWY